MDMKETNGNLYLNENGGSERINPCSLEQELAQKAGELEAQRLERESRLVELTLEGIAERVVSKEADIMAVMSAGKGQCHSALHEVVTKELLRAAEGLLWCREYQERAKCDQRVSVFTGSHWEVIETQLWKDFVGHCAERCGVQESFRTNHSFMKSLYERVAFNVSEYRRQLMPDGEVWLNVHNGTLELRVDGSVTLREHRKEDLFTYTLPYSYDANAECPLWQKFLERVLPEAKAQQVLAEFIGYCLMPRHSLEKMLWLYGDGQNGKSVTLEIIEALLGSFNVSYLSLSDLTNDEVKRAGIEGKMLNISHESGKEVNANVLKQLTSGERVLIKYLYRDPYETMNYGKFIAAFNMLPRAEITFGYFRRLIIIPYLVTITEEEKDDRLADKLKLELPGILNWVLGALANLMNRRQFTNSESCRKALDQYRLQSDNVRLFLNEMCEPSEYTMAASGIYESYRNYCISSSLKPIGKQRFFQRLESLGHQRVTYQNAAYYKLKVNES